MTFSVAKNFKSINRRHFVGDIIDPAELESFDFWRGRGFIKDDTKPDQPRKVSLQKTN